MTSHDPRRSDFRFSPFKYGDDGTYVCQASVDGEGLVEWSDERVLKAVSVFSTCKCPCPANLVNLTMTDQQLKTRVNVSSG